MNGRIITFGLVALFVAWAWIVLGRNGGERGVKTRFKDWSPQK